jgi:integrase
MAETAIEQRKLTEQHKPTERRKLTDRFLDSLKKKRPAAPFDVRDTEVPGLRVRVMPSGKCSFVLLARFKNGDDPTRRALGAYPIMSLADARKKAAAWKNMIAAGIDPAGEEERRRLAEERKQANSFAAVAEAFIAHCHKQKLRTAAMIEHDLRKTFVTAWGARPITEIQADDVKRIIRAAVDRGAKYQAHSDFTLIRRVFNWSIGTDDHGLQANPCDRLSPTDLIGAREPRERVLTDSELRALWRATERMKYPHAPLYRLLVLTGLRLGEVCGARWSEFDLEGRKWTIPALRMKKTRVGAKPFAVPLTTAMMDVLKTIPRFDSGDCLFSFTYGKTPVQPHSFSNVKEQLDALMREELSGPLPDFVNHDIRRTVRSHLSALRIAEETREAVLAHVRTGIKKHYDQHDYFAEKLEALTLWNERLRSIVEPLPANVMALRAKS